MRFAVVLNYNHFAETITCATRLLNNGIAHVVIVDNDSLNDSMAKLVQQFKSEQRVSVIQTHKNLGYAKGNNFGLAYINDRYPVSDQNTVFVVNPDSAPSKKNIEEITDFLMQTPDAGIVSVKQQGNAYTAWHHMQPLRSLWFNSRIVAKVMAHWQIREVRPYHLNQSGALPVDVISGAFFGVKQAVMAEIKGFDEGTFLYYEEEGLYCRLRMRGYQSYLLTSSTFEHAGQGSTRMTSHNMLKYYHQSQLYLMTKYYHVGRLYRAIYSLTNKVDELVGKLIHPDH